MSNFINVTEGTVTVPKGDGIGSALTINVKSILTSEGRLKDAAFANAHTAPELMAAFNKSWLDLGKILTAVNYERAMAQNRVSTSHAEAILNATNEELAKRGHPKASADLRKALADIDKAYLSAKECLDKIDAVRHFLSCKITAFENGFTAVKKTCGNFQMPNTLNNPPEWNKE